MPLLRLLSDGEFHSGEQLGERLALTRSAVWKQIRRLREMGVEVHAITGKGYRVNQPLSLLDASSIRRNCRRLPAHCPLDVMLSVDSTNTEAMRRIERQADDMVLLAEHQQQGRGRRGRQWVSPLGHNIYLSMVRRFEQGVSALEGLSLVTALAVVEALEPDVGEGLRVKWPNDVLLNGSKLSGILLEMRGDVAGPCVVVVGVGVNTRLPAAAAAVIDQPYAALEEQLVASVDRNRLAARLIDALSANLDAFVQYGFAHFRERWQALDYFYDKAVEVRAGEQVTRGKACGVDSQGRLLLVDEAGSPLIISGGEVFPSVRGID